MKSKVTYIAANEKAFSTERAREYQFAVYTNGEVKVWDRVAAAYTSCHALSPVAIARLVAMAK